MQRRRLLAAAVLAAAAALAPPAGATTTRPVTVAELTRSSDDVIVGLVRRSVSRWEGGYIVTDHEVEVTAALKGRLPPRASVLVRVAGGVVGRVGQAIPGAPSLEDGRTYVLFLAGGVSSVRYLAHLTAAVLPVTAATTGAVQAAVPSSLVMAPGPASPSGARPALTELDVVARAVRAVAP